MIDSTDNVPRPAPACPLDEPALRDLREKAGGAFYLVDLSRFRSNLAMFEEAFSAAWSRVAFGYSYKTNYLAQLCLAASDRGWYAEVVSEWEYELARSLGVSPGQILFNGPAKRRSTIQKALVDGSLVNVDSMTELLWSIEAAEDRQDEHWSIGIRINLSRVPDCESRFGIDPDQAEFAEACRRMAALPNLRVSGLHCHLSTSARSAVAYADRTRCLIDVARSFELMDTLDFIDVGGGFFGEVDDELAARFDVEIPSFAEYADAIGGVMRQEFPGGSGPRLILEPGVAVVANTCWFVCGVEAVKRIAGESWAVTDGSLQNVRPNLRPFDVPYVRFTAPAGSRSVPAPVNLCGYTCMEPDILHRDCAHDVAEGDLVAFRNVGAYSMVFKPPFIRGMPAVFLLHDNGEIEWVLEPEPVRQAPLGRAAPGCADG